jgi:hypothetical protein
MVNKMNERIEKLAEQAEKYADDNFRGEPTWSEAFESKFAELIVLECIEVCKSRVGNSDYTTGRMHCVSDLKEHFGVEE